MEIKCRGSGLDHGDRQTRWASSTVDIHDCSKMKTTSGQLQVSVGIVNILQLINNVFLLISNNASHSLYIILITSLLLEGREKIILPFQVTTTSSRIGNHPVV